MWVYHEARNANRLPTCTRMRAWGHHQSCVLCGEPDESRDHLFFACPYSFTVWSDIDGVLLQQRQNTDWVQTTLQMRSIKGDRQHEILLLLCFQVTINSVWKERNARIHRREYIAAPQLVHQIEKLIEVYYSDGLQQQHFDRTAYLLIAGLY